MSKKYHLYFDDTGSRDPDKSYSPQVERKDQMDCFAFGGIIVREDDIDEILEAHEAFCSGHGIDYPLHSWAIRGGRKDFGWLKKPEKAGIFFGELEEFLLSLPIICTACVIDRPVYVERYKEKYQIKLWYMCKTAFSILIERSAKYVDSQDGNMEIYFEEVGKKEDRAILQYMKDLKNEGLGFDATNSEAYGPLGPEDFKRLCLGKPQRRTKKTPMIQIADLVLYPVAKAGYEPEYPPFKKLKEAGKLVDCHLREEDLNQLGVKYSCFR